VVGTLVLNRFLIERRIGSGGFGVVYEAWDGRLERTVAVKAIESRGEAGKRVLREAQAAARLNHPGIVTLYEMGEEDGNALLVSELVEGRTLARLSREGALSDREVGEVGADLCEALDHAHSRGVVHRDIKPQNVVVAPEGEFRARLMDFGVARLSDSASLTAPGDVVGTLAYMSPEQAEGQVAGPEADVYSLALTLYECWGGENPNRRTTPAATARAIGGRHRSLRRLRPDLPRELSDAIDAALQARPSRRPTLEELGSAIEEALDRLADDLPATRAPLGLRLGAVALAATLGAWLALGHGALLP
jgi:eukaryotic-like serine/threonine-protein kinase